MPCHHYVSLKRHYNIPIRRRGNVPLRRLSDVPLRLRWVFHLRRTCDVAGTYRETSFRPRLDILLLCGLILYVPILWSLLWIHFIECLIHWLISNTSLYSLWVIVTTAFLFTLFAFLCSLTFLPSIQQILHPQPLQCHLSFCLWLICLNQ